MNWSSGGLAVEELPGLGVEVVELVLEDRDQVPWDVLVHLGIGRASRACPCPPGASSGATSSLCSAAIRSPADAAGAAVGSMAAILHKSRLGFGYLRPGGHA